MQNKTKINSPASFLLIDKPSGPTSHDMVDFVRRLVGIKKVGHAGTLDPFATGLLILGIGRATKKLGEFVGLDKVYEATVRLGATSDTYDRTGKINVLKDKNITTEEIKSVLQKFTGQIEQIPPMFSAKKVAGKKLYELARKGIEIERKPINVTIFENTILDYQYPKLVLRISCSSGTYIRSLAHDIGKVLGTGAYLEELRRTNIGHFDVKNARKPDELSKLSVNKYIFDNQ